MGLAGPNRKSIVSGKLTSNCHQRSSGFALTLFLGLVALLGLLFLAWDYFLAATSQRVRRQVLEDLARANARAGLCLALRELEKSAADGAYVSGSAQNFADFPESFSHWTGLWRVRDGVATFERWLVSGAPETGDAPPQSETLAFARDLGLGDRCPLLEIRSAGRCCGHCAFWIGDESGKVRVNLPPAEVPCARIAQDFAAEWREANGLSREELAEMRFPSQLAGRKISPESLHAITLASCGLLQGTDGHWPVDLTLKLRRREFAADEFVADFDSTLPQPPPTYASIASALEQARRNPLAVAAVDEPYRALAPAKFSCPATLPELPLAEFGFHVPSHYSFHPALRGLWMDVSCRADGETFTIALVPQLALWNPLSLPLEEHPYTIECRVPWDRSRMLPNPDLPALEVEGLGMIRLGDGETGTIWSGRLSSPFAPGETLRFSLGHSGDADPGRLAGDFRPGNARGAWWISLPLKSAAGEVAVRRMQNFAQHAHWGRQTLRLCDGHSAVLFQELCDFIDDAPPATYAIPRDGQFHFLFRLCAVSRCGDDPPSRWLPHHNPLAGQIRRLVFEGFPIPGLPGSLFSRKFPPWRVEFEEGTPTPIPPFPSCPLFDVPGEIYSIATLGHLTLLPFSYHPAMALGNSAAPSILPGSCTRLVTEPDAPAIRFHEAFRGEMRLDASYLLNGALYDHHFVSGLDRDGRFFTLCRPVDSARNLTSIPSEQLAERLHNLGAFNVNSASPEAWRLLLHSLPREGGLFYFPKFPETRRLLISTADLDLLARCIWEEVRAQGRPFASLGEFVNRRIGDEADLATRSGPLQRAMERVGLPISQADFLAYFGNSLGVRGDSFLIRAYGDAVDGDFSVSSTLEAIAQRRADGTFSVEFHELDPR